MQQLGKILIIILIFTISLFSSVEIKVDKRKIIRGDSITITINAIGDKVKFSKIKTVVGYDAFSIEESKYISMINGKKFTRLSKTFKLIPLENFTIPPFIVEVDGEKKQTKTINIEVAKPQKTQNPDFDLQIYTDKKRVYVGEPIKLSIIFKRKANKKIANANFNPPVMKNFWTTKLPETKQLTNKGFNIHKIDYIIYPEKSGKLFIDNSSIEVGQIRQGTDRFSMFVERVIYKKIYSNEIKIDVKPLPKGVKLYGNYRLKVNIDKKKIKANEPVNIKVTLMGIGNIDDIDEFKINIKNITIYKDKPIKKNNFKDNRLKSTFIQKFAIIGDKDFTIPSFKIKFFNGKKIKIKSTKPIDIKVIENPKKEQSYIIKPIKDENQSEPKIVVKDSSKIEKIFYLIIGFFLALTLFLIFYFIQYNFFENVQKESNYVKLIKKSRTDKELLHILIPFVGKSKEIDLVVLKLEENIYKNFTHKINKTLLANNIEKYMNI